MITAPKKKWRTTSYPTALPKRHDSKAAAYRYVQARASEFQLGMLRPDFTRVVVWVDEGRGRGWERYEEIQLRDLSGGAS